MAFKLLGPRLMGHYGYIPDIDDHRDVYYRVARPRATVIKDAVDLRPNCSPVRDQGDEGSCTAHGITANMEWLENASGFRSTPTLSPQFLYYLERRMEGTIQVDAGAMIRDGIKAAARYGVCKEKVWPYSKPMTRKPCKQAFADAEKRQALAYFRLNGLEDMLRCLSEGFPFVFGVSVYASFESDEALKTGMVPMPGPTERPEGGHCMFGCGHDMRRKVVIVKNSWGKDVGDSGYFYLPFDYIQQATDIWTIRKMEGR